MSGLENIKNENVDLEKIPIEEVFQLLKCTSEGLTTQEGDDRIQLFGPNKLEEKKESKILKFLGFMWNPLSWVMEAAAIMAIALANGDGRPPDWQDFVGIICLLVINSTISFIEENNAGNAAAALMAGLAPKTKVLRDGKWSEQEAAILVPGDIVSIKLGDIIPADARLLEGDPLKVDQSALTGESLPVTKHPGQEVYSGSTCKQGEIEAVVIATGVRTFFGKAAHLVDSTNQVGHFQKVLSSIGTFCICSIATGMVIEIIVMYGIQKRKYRDGIDNLLVLLIGGIPIAMPTVLSVTMAIGSHRLSQQGAITKRMTAIEELAGMDVLCSDKTGTLTLNKLSVDKDLVETALTTRRDYGAGERQAEWAREQRTQHGLQTRQEVNVFPENGGYRELSQIVEQAKKRAEIARLREIHTFKGHVESVAKLKGLDIDTSGHHYTL
ncbi:hypothetical protein F2Q70_00010700 [Brassica cretica]|uniref:Cation-transporting P-type ATPase N-terminal domain-containing protein n=1 Tax=Brassica cretica TaxID=69181 RepID=A0A8S9LTH6_BRACR|nr:hypothetical protein F2Q70_00010700 [Brassica cretica]